jgi:hypothetical protein
LCVVRAAFAGLGCLFLPFLAFGLIIAWADYSMFDKRLASVYGLAAVLVIALGLGLLYRVNLAIFRRRRPRG